MATKTTGKARAKAGTKGKTSAKRATAKGGKKPAAKRSAKAKAARKPREPNGERKLGLLGAAAQVLASEKRPMTVAEMVEAVVKGKLWTPGAGLTPAATLAAAINREISVKETESRFVKVERGLYGAAGVKLAKRETKAPLAESAA